LCWIGHSMGGMVIYAYLGLAQNGLRPAAAVTLATPVRFAQKATGLTQSIGSLLLSLPFPNRVPQRIPLGILWHVVGRTRALEVGMNPENIDPRVVRRALRRSLSDGSRRKLQQLADWARTGRFTSLDGGIDYRENLRKVTTPTLILCGASDPLAPPECSEPAYELLAAARKRFVVVGRASGFSMDYGHVDLILGQRAPEEVFPLVASWVGETLSMEGR
ncbi:MAG: alpha/beta fold hydrolase, partial [Myxococcota bacterium]